jgi:basic membrane lipoprotein Med (substrate-binding protein (PBP1-ABC) superfamily)
MDFEAKDGKVHAYYFTEIATKGMKTVKAFDLEYNEKLNDVLADFQKNGFEIVDVKIMAGYSQALDSLVRTLVLYKFAG